MPMVFSNNPNNNYKMGDIVWVRVKGFPWWPGQVMDLSQASERMLQDRPGKDTLLVSTFADGQYCWAVPANIRKFHERTPEVVKKASLAARLQQAVEEAKEVMATRRGKQAATNHQPLDFLNPPEGASLVVAEGKPQAGDYPGAPEPLGTEGVAAVDLEATLRQLRRLAICADEGVDGESEFVRFLYAWRLANFTTAKPGRRGSGVRQKSEVPQRESTPEPAPKKKRKRSTGKKAEAAEEEEEEVEEEEEDNSNLAEEDGEEAISDMEHAEGRDEGSDDEAAEEGQREEGNAEQKPKKRKYVRKKAKEAVEEEAEEEEEVAEPDEEAMWGVLRGSHLQGALGFLKRMAVPRSADAIGRPGLPSYASARATLLLARELQYSRSSLQREGQIGYLAELSARDAILHARKQSRKPPKPGKPEKAKAAPSGGGRSVQGIPVEAPEIGDTAMFKEYSDRVASTPEAFQEDLEAFYNSHGKSLSAPVVAREQLDLYVVFKAVAALGGYESVTYNREWPAVAKKWRDDLSVGGRAVIPKKYVQFLLAYEDHASAGAPQRELQRAPIRAPKAAAPPTSLARAGGGKAKKRRRTPDSDADEASLDGEANREAALNISDDDDDFKPKGKGTKAGAKRKTKKSDVPPNAKVSDSKVPKKRAVDFSALAEDRGPQTSRKAAGRKAEPPQQKSSVAPPKPTAPLSTKPLSEQRRVVKLRFAQGLDMPSRGKVGMEMKRHGEIQDVQVFAKSNIYTYTFGDEAYATAAVAALAHKIPVSWNVPKDSVTVTQDVHRPPAVPRQHEGGPSNMSSITTGASIGHSSGRGPGMQGSAFGRGTSSASDAARQAAVPLGNAAKKVLHAPQMAAPSYGQSQAVASHSAIPVDPRQQQRPAYAPQQPVDPRTNVFRAKPGPAAFYPMPHGQLPHLPDPRQQFRPSQPMPQLPQWAMQEQQNAPQAYSNPELPRGAGLPPLDLPQFDVTALASIMQNVEAQSRAQQPQPRPQPQHSQAPDLQALLQGGGAKPVMGQGGNPGQPVDPRTRNRNGAQGMEAPTLAGDEGGDVEGPMLALMRGIC